MSAQERLVPVFMPPLAALLARAEELKGGLLTRSEVERIRDGAVCMMVRESVALAMEESRGYRDLSPEDCWEEWQGLRAGRGENGGEGR